MLRVLGAWWSSPGTQMTHWRRGPGFPFGHFLPQFIPCHGKDKAYGKKFRRWKSIQKGAHGCVCVCMCECVYVCMCACWGILVTLMAFISGQWNAAKTFSLLLLLIHGHTHECSLYIHSLQRKLLFLLRVHPMGSSSVLSQYLNFFLRSRKRLRCTLGSVRGCGGAGSSFLPSVSAPSKASKEP